MRLGVVRAKNLVWLGSEGVTVPLAFVPANVAELNWEEDEGHGTVVYEGEARRYVLSELPQWAREARMKAEEELEKNVSKE